MHSPRTDTLCAATTRAVLVVLALLVATPATAFQIYTDRSAWEAAVSSYGEVSDGLGSAAPAAQSITTQPVSALTLFRAAISASRFAASSMNGDPSEPLIGFAADWQDMGNATASASSPLTAYANLAEPATATSANASGASCDAATCPTAGFIGIVGDPAFIQASLHSNAASLDSGLEIENLAVATASAPMTAAMPEPSGLLVFSLGFAVLAARTRYTSARLLAGS